MEKNNNNLQQSQAELEQSIQHIKHVISQSVVIAFERTGSEPINGTQIESMVNDVLVEFPSITEHQIKTALRNGGLGKYGKTFRLSTQELCIWIRTFLNEKIDRQPVTLDY